MEDLVCVLSTALGSVSVRSVLKDFNCTVVTFALLPTLLLQTQRWGREVVEEMYVVTETVFQGLR